MAPASVMTPRGAGLAIYVWSVAGVLATLVDAVVRLLPRALEPLQREPLEPWLIPTYLGAMIALAYSEGYRGFQLRFSPRVVVRALHLARRPSPALVMFAPLVVMGLLHATRRRLIHSWLLLVTIVGLILLVRMLAQPWRGIVDAGVITGLSWGGVATIALSLQALRGRVPNVDPDLPPDSPLR